MAEITSGDVTVMVLSPKESDALATVLVNAARYSAGPWGDALDNLHEVLDAFGVVA